MRIEEEITGPNRLLPTTATSTDPPAAASSRRRGLLPTSRPRPRSASSLFGEEAVGEEAVGEEEVGLAAGGAAGEGGDQRPGDPGVVTREVRRVPSAACGVPACAAGGCPRPAIRGSARQVQP
jgi:hypothetical protein